MSIENDNFTLNSVEFQSRRANELIELINACRTWLKLAFAVLV
jgi:hypothetical protein